MEDKGAVRSFNTKLIVVAASIVGLCAYKLALVATTSGNEHGAWLSFAHVVIVAVGVVLALRKTR